MPSAFDRYEKMGGVLDFAVFEDSGGAEQEITPAIPQALRHASTFDETRLQALGCRLISHAEFFGEWYDLESGALLRAGSYRTVDGSMIRNPTFPSLDDLNIVSGSTPIPEVGLGGQFAYSFAWGLDGKPSEIQNLFDEIINFILPMGEQVSIMDWSSPYLPEVSDYFSDGIEWWGVFLFTIYVPGLRQLTIIAGSTTD
nr:hypothetical protein [uncultured Sphingomonas sp.]